MDTISIARDGIIDLYWQCALLYLLNLNKFADNLEPHDFKTSMT